MILYRLALQRIIDYLRFDQVVKYEVPKRKKHKTYKTKLQTDRTMNLCISILLSIINWLVCLSIPYAVLESCCKPLKEHNFHTLYTIAKWLERYKLILDTVTIILLVILVYVSVETVLSAIKKTDITVSPWIERGKYSMPYRRRRKQPFFWF